MSEISKETKEKINTKLADLLSQMRVATAKMERLAPTVTDPGERAALNELNTRAAVYLHDIILMLGDHDRPMQETLDFIDLVEHFCQQVDAI